MAPRHDCSVFISYRRTDTGGYAGRLADALDSRFGAGRVFHDVETMLPGTDFAASIHAAIASASVVPVLIGDEWLDARDATGGRLPGRDDDVVCMEATTALAGGKAVLPLLVEGARMPATADLPTDLCLLAGTQVLKRSTGTMDGKAIHVSLEWVFERMPPETGRFRLSSDGRTLSGELRVPDRDPEQARFAPVALMRR